ncbi:hypothetical protein Rhe02_38030 [Rhizocola hellebori]|uniref:Integral membrane protein n=1 Tax=Rhizocola hellebori TaxID=1392758 RepID=A0A8J3Q9S9_9ACTN|nr:hypothetical protein [Rhizocola hellebori]GIH05736.1 hypothetical protein Rhe02_38030 [Rhizocola hellebori]
MKWEGVSLGMLWAQEYERLKEEQAQRISIRDNLMYATLVSIAGVILAMYQTSNADLLLLLPLGCVVLGWTYLANDEKISAIGRYIRTDLEPRLAALLDAQPPVYGWELAHRSDRRRRSRKVAQLCIDLMTFCLPGAGALVIRGLSPNFGTVTAVIVIAEASVVLLLAQQILANADLSRGRSSSATEAAVFPIAHNRD